MKKLEKFYAVANEKEKLEGLLLKDKNPQKLITDFDKYFAKIEEVPKGDNPDLTLRRRYLSVENAKVIVALIKTFGDTFPKEIITLINNLEFWVLLKIEETGFTPFEFLMKNYSLLKEMELLKLLSKTFYYAQENIFGKKISCSSGTFGTGIKGFNNEAYMNTKISQDDLNLVVNLNVFASNFDIDLVSKAIGVNEDMTEYQETLKNLLDYRKQTSERYAKKNTGYVSLEKQFHLALYDFTVTHTQALTDKYNIHLSVGTFFESREDCFTDFYINPIQLISFNQPFEDFKNEFIEVIKLLNKVDNEIFSTNQMIESKRKFYIGLQEEFKKEPLFS